MGKRMLLRAIVLIGISLVSFLPVGANEEASDDFHNHRYLQAGGRSCSRFKNCKKCLKVRKGMNCAWAVSGSSSKCVDEAQCDSNEEAKCITNETPFGCGAACETIIDRDGCDNCVTMNGVACAWFVQGNVSLRCIGKERCSDRGFEAGSCIISKRKKRLTCEKINRKCKQIKNCTECLTFRSSSRRGTNCAWWHSQDGSVAQCVGLEQCSNKESGTCIQRKAFSTDESVSIEESCEIIPPPSLSCLDFLNCEECSKEEGCFWNQDAYGDKCGFGRGACRSEVGVYVTPDIDVDPDVDNTETCPVLPKCDTQFPNLENMLATDAVEYLEKQYGKGTLCVQVLGENDFHTEDYRCDRLRLFVDNETRTIVVKIPQIG